MSLPHKPYDAELAAIRARLEELGLHGGAALERLSAMTFEAETKRQSETLVADIQALRAEVDALRAEMRRPRPIA